MLTRLTARAAQFTRQRRARRAIKENRRRPGPPIAEPVWPLPRRAGGPSNEELLTEFARYEQWHYTYKFDGQLTFPEHHKVVRARTRHAHLGALQCDTDVPERPLQRFRHFMSPLLHATGGTLAGKRVLDIGCNSGFWSIQCALLGAREVVGFDARAENIEQANLVKSIVGVTNADFRHLDYWEMSPATLGGPFDVVLHLGVLFHLPKLVEALELCRSMAREFIVLDTIVLDVEAPLIKLRWEEPDTIRHAAAPGIVMTPSARSVELVLRHLKFADWTQAPVRTVDAPADYVHGLRASWLIRV